MSGVYKNINKKDDFDILYSDFGLTKNKYIDILYRHYIVFAYILIKADILIFSFNAGYLNFTLLRWFEFYAYKLIGIKTIFIPYGGDAFISSRIRLPYLKHVLRVIDKNFGKYEYKIKKQVEFFSIHADFIIGNHMVIDGLPRYDLLVYNAITIDTSLVKNDLLEYSSSDGINEIVKIAHSPNHRGAKGTEFLIKAVDELKKEGYKIELILLENMQNSEVLSIIKEVDILAEQFIGHGYALSGIEGMSLGKVIMCNLSNDVYVSLFKRYGYLKDCPAYSTTPENIKENLKTLITNSELRKELGEKGRKYVEKYHSNITAQIMFQRIFQKIYYNEDIDLINYFHPLIGQYEKDYEFYIKHKKLPKFGEGLDV